MDIPLATSISCNSLRDNRIFLLEASAYVGLFKPRLLLDFFFNFWIFGFYTLSPHYQSLSRTDESFCLSCWLHDRPLQKQMQASPHLGSRIRNNSNLENCYKRPEERNPCWLQFRIKGIPYEEVKLRSQIFILSS